MKNVSIYDKKWLNLVFEEKNKEYGAYTLRQDEEKTTLKAFFSSVAVIIAILATFVFFTSFGDKPEEITIVLVRPVSPEIFKIAPAKPKIQKKQVVRATSKVVTILKTATMEIVEHQKADTEIPKNTELTTTIIDVAGGSLTGVLPTADNSNSSVGFESTKTNHNIENSGSVDIQPFFPGGIERFYAYVGRTFEKPELDAPSSTRILISFVIERDGAMSDIKVLSKTNDDLNAEAIRVLKSLKTKWTAGIKDGQAVRTKYTLPITVVSE